MAKGPQQAPTWGQAAPGSKTVAPGIPQYNTPVLGAGGMPTVTPEMQQQALYVPPKPQINYMALLQRLNQAGGSGSQFARGGSNPGYSTSGRGAFGSGSSKMGGRAY